MILIEIKAMQSNEVECCLECLYFCIDTIQIDCKCRCHPQN